MYVKRGLLGEFLAAIAALELLEVIGQVALEMHGQVRAASKARRADVADKLFLLSCMRADMAAYWRLFVRCSKFCLFVQNFVQKSQNFEQELSGFIASPLSVAKPRSFPMKRAAMSCFGRSEFSSIGHACAERRYALPGLCALS